MDTKTGLIIAGTFVAGIGVGAGIAYLMTKKSCDIHTQEAINEMKEAFKKEKESEDIKKEIKNEDNKEEAKEESAKTISEMSSIDTSDHHDISNYTMYNYKRVKEAIKKAREEQPAERHKLVAKDYNSYMELEDSEINSEMEFVFNTESETWVDWNKVEYEVDDLPFNPDDVQWFDDQCYLVDEEDGTAYILEKV